MKRRSSIKNRVVAKRRQSRVSRVGGLIDSPMFKGLVELIPVLVVLVVVSLNLSPVNDELRNRQHQAGRFPHSALAHWSLARETAKKFDYSVAEREYRLGEKYIDKDSPILGASSEIGDMVWPEIKVEEELKRMSDMDGVSRSRSLLLKLAIDYWSLGDNKSAREMLEEAVSIDPNDGMTGEVRQLLDEEGSF